MSGGVAALASDGRSLANRRFANLALATLVGALVLGGASRADAASGLAVGILCLPLLAAVLWRLTGTTPRASRLPLLFIGGLVLIPFLQLVPLPPEIWSRLPGHAALAADDRLLGPAPGRPISLAPAATLNAALSLAPPAAAFLATLLLDADDRERLIAAVLIVAAASALIGALQVAGGPGSPLRLYAITNRDVAVGLFANRDHQAIFLTCATPMAATWAFGREGPLQRRLFRRAVGGVLIVLLIVGAALTRSRAGLLLGTPAAGVSLALVLRAGGGRLAARAVMLGGVAALAAGLILLFGPEALATRFQSEPLAARWALTPLFLKIGATYAPFGAGLGSFDPVYRMFEPASLVGPSYLNHAHDDYAELWIEAGWFAAVAVTAFLIRAAKQAWAAWTAPASGNRWRAQARLGTVVVGLLLLHSAADYPLRTPALACLFALACGLMVSPAEPSTA